VVPPQHLSGASTSIHVVLHAARQKPQPQLGALPLSRSFSRS